MAPRLSLRRSWGGVERFLYGVGVIEIIAGLLVAFKPKLGGYVVAVWLFGIIGNLLLQGHHLDVALRDLGLALGALSLARLAHQFDFNGTHLPLKQD